MIVGLIRVVLKVLVAAAAAAVVLTIAGDSLRPLVPEAYHRALWLTGLFISVPCAFGALLMRAFAPARRKLENLLLVGTAIGALLCLLFITGIDCKLTQLHGRSPRLELSCRELK